VIVRRAVDVVRDDGQLLATSESLVTHLTREAIHVKDELFDSHHQLRRRHGDAALGTASLHVSPASIFTP